MAIDTWGNEPNWDRFPITAAHPEAKRWIQSGVLLGLARNTILAYTRASEAFLGFCQSHSVDARNASRDVIAQHVGELRAVAG